MNKLISVTIGGETRVCETSDLKWGYMVLDNDVELVTTHGSSSHRGTVYVDGAGRVISANYPGMRGNGAGRKSNFRNIAWADPAEAVS